MKSIQIQWVYSFRYEKTPILPKITHPHKDHSVDMCTLLLCRDTSRDDYRNPCCRDASRDDCKNSYCRDTSRYDCRNPYCRDIIRGDCSI